MRKLIISFFLISLMATPILAQDEKVALEFYERCNNWARYYCMQGNHERAVNLELLNMKKRGVVLTAKIIRGVARRVPKNTYVPSEPE